MTGSSPEAETFIESATDTTDATSAVSSSATEGEKSTLDLVNEALSAAKEESPASTQEKAQSETSETKSDVDPAKASESDITEEERKQWTPNVRKRIDNLVAQRYERDRAIEELKPKAAQFEAIDTFARESNLSGEDLGRIMELGALVKNDPFKAYDALMPIIQQLADMTGKELPPEVQERVNLGYLTKEDAQRLVQSERQLAFVSHRHTQAAEREQAETAQRATLQRIAASESAANAWEQRQKATDPDFTLKSSRIQQALEIEMSRRALRGGVVPTPDEVVTLLNAAHKAATEEIRKLRPASKPATFVGGTTSARSTAEPGSLIDAMEAALAGNR